MLNKTFFCDNIEVNFEVDKNVIKLRGYIMGEIILYERNELETEEFQITSSTYDFHIGILVDKTPNCL